MIWQGRRKPRHRLIIACAIKNQINCYSQEIKMNQHEIIKNALKLTDKLDQLQTRLWERYYNQFLDLLAEEDISNPPLDNQKVDWPF
jgi:hypothetical protein